MILSFHPCFDAEVQVVLGSRGLNAQDLAFITQAEAIILPQAQPQGLFEACSGSGAHLFPCYDVRFKYPGKIGQSLLFETLGCRHPETLRWTGVDHFRKACPDLKDFPHDVPFLIKDDKSHEADGVFVVKYRPSLSRALDFLTRREGSGFPGFVTQAFVPTDGNVLRAVIIGRKIITYWKRPAEPGQFITTISKGAVIDPLWRPDLQDKGRAAVQALSEKTGIDLAAVDLVFSLSEQMPEPLFLEINYYFGRRGLGGSERYYRLLHQAIREWLEAAGLDGDVVRLI